MEIFHHSGEIFGPGKSMVIDTDKFYIMGKALLNFAKHTQYHRLWKFLVLFAVTLKL